MNILLLASIVLQMRPTPLSGWSAFGGARKMPVRSAFGHRRGVLEGVCAAAGIPLTLLTPAAGKKRIGLAARVDKHASRSEAIRRFPSQAHLFAHKKDDGRARWPPSGSCHPAWLALIEHCLAEWSRRRLPCSIAELRAYALD